MVFREIIEYTFQFLIEAIFHIIRFILCWDMNIQKTPSFIYECFGVLTLYRWLWDYYMGQNVLLQLYYDY
jgi:hypothetical protein